LTVAKRYVSVGRLGKTRGLTGEIYVTPSTDFPDRFLSLKEIYVSDRNGWDRMLISSTRMIGARPVLKFRDVDTPEDAARLTNRELAVTDDQLVELPDGTYYVFDLVGCAVCEATSGRMLGEVIDVRQYPANDVYVIRTGSGKEVLFPAVRPYIKRVDIGERKIMVEPGDLFDET